MRGRQACHGGATDRVVGLGQRRDARGDQLAPVELVDAHQAGLAETGTEGLQGPGRCQGGGAVGAEQRPGSRARASQEIVDGVM